MFRCLVSHCSGWDWASVALRAEPWRRWGGRWCAARPALALVS